MTYRQSSNRWRARAIILKKQLKKARNQARAVGGPVGGVGLLQAGRKGIRPTLRSRIGLGIRKNLVNVASRHVGMLLCRDISKDTVNRAETVACAALVGSLRSWFDVVRRRWAEAASDARQGSGLPGSVFAPLLPLGDADVTADSTASVVLAPCSGEGVIAPAAEPRRRLHLTTCIGWLTLRTQLFGSAGLLICSGWRWWREGRG